MSAACPRRLVVPTEKYIYMFLTSMFLQASIAISAGRGTV